MGKVSVYMLSIAAAMLLLCCQAYWPCERLCILICLSTAVSEPRGSSHSHRLSFCGDGSTSQVPPLLWFQKTSFSFLLWAASVHPLSLLQRLRQTLGYPAGHAPMLLPVACFVFVLFRTGLSVSRARPLQPCCVFYCVCFEVQHLSTQLPFSGSIFTTTHPTFGLSWHKVLYFWILC